MVSAQTTTLWQLVRQSDTMTYGVLILLLAMSLFTWTVFVYKLLIWRFKQRELSRLQNELKTTHTFEGLVQLAGAQASTFGGLLLAKILSHLKSVLAEQDGRVRLTDRRWMLFEYLVGQSVNDLVMRESRIIPMVAACMTISPLIGLYGTVWGLVHAFMEISHQQSADIAAVAPGIAMALITTIAGLVVAIPAAFIYYHLQLQVRNLEAQLESIADRSMVIVQQLFVE